MLKRDQNGTCRNCGMSGEGFAPQVGGGKNDGLCAQCAAAVRTGDMAEFREFRGMAARIARPHKSYKLKRPQGQGG